MTDPLAVCAFYSARAIVVKLALVAQRIVGHDVAYAMTWIDLRKKMTDKYCPRNKIKKLETELWNLKVKGTDVTGYNQLFPGTSTVVC
ncbi:hypothetical protein Tco_0306919 [Tanacetum coccineum]